jgi:hypothetical protein
LAVAGTRAELHSRASSGNGSLFFTWPWIISLFFLYAGPKQVLTITSDSEHYMNRDLVSPHATYHNTTVPNNFADLMAIPATQTRATEATNSKLAKPKPLDKLNSSLSRAAGTRRGTDLSGEEERRSEEPTEKAEGPKSREREE